MAKKYNDGVYYTPTIIAKECHAYLANVFGSGWTYTYTVWDCASGQGQLTSGLTFSNLYSSTLEYNDVKNSTHNPEAVHFQFDFLNGDFSILPEKLKNNLLNDDFLFFINPPYLSGAMFGEKRLNNGKTITNTAKEMKHKKVSGTKNLYTQFIYKITELKKQNPKIRLAIICPPLFLTGTSFQKFREYIFSEWKFNSGLIFRANHFSGVSGDWGCIFAIFE